MGQRRRGGNVVNKPIGRSVVLNPGLCVHHAVLSDKKILHMVSLDSGV